MCKDLRQDSGQYNFFYARYSEKLICPNLQSFVWRRHVGAYPDGQPIQRPETDRNINLILAVRFRATFLKTVRLSKQVLRESGSDRNFGYIQSLSTVCSRPLSYTHTHTHTHTYNTHTHIHIHTHQCFQNGCHKKTLVGCLDPLCMDLESHLRFTSTRDFHVLNSQNEDYSDINKYNGTLCCFSQPIHHCH